MAPVVEVAPGEEIEIQTRDAFALATALSFSLFHPVGRGRG
jgi:hypothetical protein